MSFISSQSFYPIFSETKGKQKLWGLKICYHPNTNILTKIEQKCEILLISSKVVGVTLSVFIEAPVLSRVLNTVFQTPPSYKLRI